MTAGTVARYSNILLGWGEGGSGPVWPIHIRQAAQSEREACDGRPGCGGEWAAKNIKRPALPAQPQCTNHWAPLTRKRHHKEHRPQRPSESIDSTQHAKGRAGDCPGPRQETATRRNVTQRAQGGGGGANGTPCHIQHSSNTPTTGLRERGNDTSKSTGRSVRQKAATRRNMRREKRVTVQGPVKEQQPDGMSHRGQPGWGPGHPNIPHTIFGDLPKPPHIRRPIGPNVVRIF